jgi:DNA-binding NarL/FixJ family response regulator
MVSARGAEKEVRMPEKKPNVQPGYEVGKTHDGPLGDLTSREKEVLRLLLDGKAQIEIHPLIGVTKQRVTQIVASLRRKGALPR